MDWDGAAVRRGLSNLLVERGFRTFAELENAGLPVLVGKFRTRQLVEIMQHAKARGIELGIPPEGTLDLTLVERNLSIRTTNALRDAGLSITDAALKTEAELLQLPCFGRKSLNELKEALASLGLTLKG